VTKTIAVLHPGEMGAAIAACLAARGSKIAWASDGRSAATRTRAESAGMEDLRMVERALGAADVVLSVCPPHGALRLAREVARRGFRGIYVDANAVAPETARQIARAVEAAGASFVDGGIIGPPPARAGTSRIYLSGSRAADIAALFAGSNLEAIPLEGAAGAASALKACYAAWTKGATALLAAIRVLAQHEGIEPALLAEWKLSQPGLDRRSEAVSVQARKAWRWVGEMEEIAASFEATGLPGGFGLAAAEIYGTLRAFKSNGRAPELQEVVAAIRQGARKRKAASSARRRGMRSTKEAPTKGTFKFGRSKIDASKPHRFLK